MTLLPRSLLWRTFILLAALVLATTAAWFEIFRAYELEPRARQVTYNLVSIVNLTRTALITSQPDRRHELLEERAERSQRRSRSNPRGTSLRSREALHSRDPAARPTRASR